MLFSSVFIKKTQKYGSYKFFHRNSILNSFYYPKILNKYYIEKHQIKKMLMVEQEDKTKRLQTIFKCLTPQ